VFSSAVQSQQEQNILEFLAALSYKSVDLDSYLHEIVCGVSRILNSDWSIITVCCDNKGKVVASNLDVGNEENGFSLDEALLGKVIQTRQFLIIEDGRIEVNQIALPEGYLCYLGVPLQTANGEYIGTICSFFRQPRSFTVEVIKVVNIFARLAATAIDNYQLYQQQQQFNQLLEVELKKRTEELQAVQAQLLVMNARLELQIQQLTAELQQAKEQLQAEIKNRQQVELAFVRDISERQAELHACKQAEQAKARLAEIGELAAMIVHEVRNPLTTILLGLTSFKNLELPEQSQQRLVLALEEADRLKNLLNEILLYTKRQVVHTSKLEVNLLIAEILEQIRYIPFAANRTIEFVSTLPLAWIFGDRDKLRQVFINLIKNACEAVDEGEIITCQVLSATINNRICISIHNNGDPIPSQVLTKLGTPFFTTKPSGNGLGLAIVKQIVEAHEGELKISSTPKTGTTVTVSLPLLPENK
jgi:signal transduction histidine kinase